MPSIDNDFHQLMRSSHAYYAAFRNWQNGALTKSLPEALPGAIAVNDDWARKLNAMTFTSPQAEYARCLIVNSLSHDTEQMQASIAKPKFATVQESYDSIPLAPDQGWMLRLQAFQGYIVETRNLTDKAAIDGLAKECPAKPITKNTPAASMEDLLAQYQTMQLAASFPAYVPTSADTSRTR